MRRRELTQAERMRWGACPVCEAPDGEWCHAEVGMHLGVKGAGRRMETGDGVHLARIRNAPTWVEEIALAAPHHDPDPRYPDGSPVYECAACGGNCPDHLGCREERDR